MDLKALLERDSFQQGAAAEMTPPARLQRPTAAKPAAPMAVALQLDDVTAIRQTLEKLLQLERAKVPEGVVTSVSLLIGQTALYATQRFNPPLMQIEIINDSSTTFSFRVPDDPTSSWTPVKASETQSVGWDFPVIASVGFQVAAVVGAAGLAVRVIGTR